MKRTLFLVICFTLTTFAAAQLRYAVLPETPRPGEPVTIGISGFAREAVLIVNGKQLAKSTFFTVLSDNGNSDFLAAVLTIPSTAGGGNSVIRLENEWGTLAEIPITIAQRDFASEVIELNPVLTSIRIDPSPQRTEEASRLWTILNTTGNTIYHMGPFVLPVNSTRRTSFFGDRRVFLYSDGNSDTSIHAGVDFGVPTGTEVYACGTGRVVLARMRIVTGNSIIIEHSPGIYSLYYHLDSINVREGAIVTAGMLIGLSGTTGLSTGPHLHWEVRVSAENTDPDAFVSRSIIDKDLIISKIYN